MGVDRRDLLTGMAATGASLCQGFGWQAAAILPALPAHGASFGAERFYYSVSFLFSLATPSSDAAYAAHHARWHFDPNPKGRALVKHEASGLAFRLAPQPADPFVMEAVFIDAPLDGWPDVEEMAAVGRASVWAFGLGENLCYWERRPGAIYFRRRHRYPGGYIPPYVEDAPALS